METIGAMLWGLAAAAAFWLTTLGQGGPDDRLLPESERGRRQRLRARSPAYCWLEPAVDTLAGWNRRAFPGVLARLGARLELLGERDWRAEEYLAVKQLEAAPAFGLAAL